MLFEYQQHQQNCIANILQALKGCDLDALDAKDFTLCAENLAKLNLNNRYPINPKRKQLDVLMETGTGKTFTYLNTIFELNQKMHCTKFIIVLPRTAIKLGVIQNINLTKEYFFNQYGKHLNYIDYPQAGLATINQDFIQSNDLSVLITTNSAFNSEKNNINKRPETLYNFGSTWEGIASKKPIVIIDEPHLLKGSETQKGLARLTHSLSIRFGATYPKGAEDKLTNLVYALDSITAFNEKLVKKIGVSTVFMDSEQGSLNIKDIKARTSFKAHYNINQQLHETTVKLKDDLGAKTGLAGYNGVTVTKINSKEIALSNHTKISSAPNNYELTDTEITQLIRSAIDLHFQKEERLFQQGVKALALFFIPNIADFRGDNPRIKTIFEEQYKMVRQTYYDNSKNKDYKKYLDNDFDANDKLQVHDGYFSGDKGNKDKKEAAGVDLILNNKEKLLSFATPLRFVFSVWALQEGWDNPNIFTLCKLANTEQETSRRQQVGRGLRIAVNQEGKRLTEQALQTIPFHALNHLDVIVSGQEQDFIYGIQNEIQAASFSLVGDTVTLTALIEKGLTDIEASLIFAQLVNAKIINKKGNIQSSISDFLKAHRDQLSAIDDPRYKEIKNLFTENHSSPVTDNNKTKRQVNIRPKQWQKFKKLWETINKKATIVYQGIQEEELIATIAQEFNDSNIVANPAKVRHQEYDPKTNTVINKKEETLATNNDYFRRHPLPQFMLKFAQESKQPLPFIMKLFSQLNLEKFQHDPKRAQDSLRHSINEKIHASVVQSVNYKFSETKITPNALQDESGNPKNNINASDLGQFFDEELTPKDQYLYDKIVYDSNIEKDSITNDPTEINDNEITVFAKLPKINIPTPYKTYNPDFAYLIQTQNDKQLFLIVETKGYKYEGNIPAEEQHKIEYGIKFFEALQEQLKHTTINIKYKTRINQQELSDLLNEITDLK